MISPLNDHWSYQPMIINIVISQDKRRNLVCVCVCVVLVMCNIFDMFYYCDAISYRDMI